MDTVSIFMYTIVLHRIVRHFGHFLIAFVTCADLNFMFSLKALYYGYLKLKLVSHLKTPQIHQKWWKVIKNHDFWLFLIVFEVHLFETPWGNLKATMAKTSFKTVPPELKSHGDLKTGKKSPYTPKIWPLSRSILTGTKSDQKRHAGNHQKHTFSRFEPPLLWI